MTVAAGHEYDVIQEVLPDLVSSLLVLCQNEGRDLHRPTYSKKTHEHFAKLESHHSPGPKTTKTRSGLQTLEPKMFI